MTDAKNVAVVDIGKTNAKVALVDTASWREIAVRTMPNRVVDEAPYPHFDIDGLWSFILTSLRDLNPAGPIQAISITTHGASAVLVDAAGDLALPMLDYEHDGPDTLADAYDAVRPEFAETGTPRLPVGLNLGAQIYWQMKTFPEAFARVDRILTYPQYWAFRLTGVPANEATSLGCHTDLWNPRTSCYSGMVGALGWTERMAPVRRAAEVLGNLDRDVAVETGLAADIPVYCGIHDSNASLYPHVVRRQAPFAVVSTGTWVISMAIGGATIDPDPRRDTLVNVNALGEPVPSARFMGGREFDLLMADRPRGCTARDIAAIAEKAALLLPAIEPNSGPFQGWRADWTVPPDRLSSGEYAAAVSAYLAHMTATCLDLCGADGPVVVEGPFARNDAYLALLAAAVGRGVVASAGNATGTAIGAAMLAEDGAGGPDDAGGVSADPEMTAAAAGLFRQWRRHLSGRR